MTNPYENYDSWLYSAFICELCGQITSDWWSLDTSTWLCKCNDCLKRMEESDSQDEIL